MDGPSNLSLTSDDLSRRSQRRQAMQNVLFYLLTSTTI
jgi:hypothetical protein